MGPAAAGPAKTERVETNSIKRIMTSFGVCFMAEATHAKVQPSVSLNFHATLQLWFNEKPN